MSSRDYTHLLTYRTFHNKGSAMSYKDHLTRQAMIPKPRLEVQEPPQSRETPLAKRILKRAVRASNGCLEWRGQVNNCGYGVVFFQTGPGPENRTSTTVHRKYWELVKGKIPEGMQVNHRCDNRICINPDHMFLGTQLDNMRDMIKKRRDNFYGRRTKYLRSED
jgi:hypothetical protein